MSEHTPPMDRIEFRCPTCRHVLTVLEGPVFGDAPLVIQTDAAGPCLPCRHRAKQAEIGWPPR